MTESAAAPTVIVPCPDCGELAEHLADLPVLECPECGQSWACEVWRTPAQLVEFIREKLAGDQDASRRAFYNAGVTLRDIAEAVDACPKDETNRSSATVGELPSARAAVCEARSVLVQS